MARKWAISVTPTPGPAALDQNSSAGRDLDLCRYSLPWSQTGGHARLLLVGIMRKGPHDLFVWIEVKNLSGKTAPSALVVEDKGVDASKN